jgi:hypothetical protein
VRDSYAGKFALAAFVGILIPLAVFIVYMLLSRADWTAMYPALRRPVLACFMGFLGTMWILRELLVPIDLTAEALRNYIEKRELPDLPISFPDRAGKLMEGTQYTLSPAARDHQPPGARLRHRRPHRHLQPPRGREAPRRGSGARRARPADLPARLLRHQHLQADQRPPRPQRGDACISHLANLLQLNTRRGDWVARWGGDEFIVGLHRNRALKMVMERIVKAIAASPCEIAPGLEVRLSVSCGVAEYRFGGGPVGVLADADKAMYAAKELAHRDGKSHVCYRSELSDLLAVGEAKAVSYAD